MSAESLDGFLRFVRRIADHGLENASRRYYSKYMGIVSSNADAQGQGRVKVSCQAATGFKDDLDMWAHPSAEYAGRDHGIYFPPEEGSRVWVWFDHGDPKVPKYSGAFWRNTGDAKKIDTSDIPAEFKTHIAEDGTAHPVTTRGIKTARGHGILFEDDPDFEGPSPDDPDTNVAGTRVEVWTGRQPEDLEWESKPAIRQNQILMVDGNDDPGIAVRTDGGPFFVMRSKSDLQEAKVETPAGYLLHILEGAKKILLQTPGGYGAVIDEGNKRVEFYTESDRGIEASDADREVLVRDPQGNLLKFSDDGVALTSTEKMDITAPGLVTLTAQGVTIQNSGTVISNTQGTTLANFTGLVTENFLGALMQVVTGLWSFTATTMLLLSSAGSIGAIQVGDVGGAKYFLVDSRFFTLYNGHIHMDSLSAPTTAPTAPWQAAVGAQTTQVTKAN